MEVTTVSHGLAIVLAVTGRLDAETVTPFGARLFDLIAEGHRRIIVNLAGLGYINSAGLRVLLVAAKRLNADGGRLLLAAPGDLVGRVSTYPVSQGCSKRARQPRKRSPV